MQPNFTLRNLQSFCKKFFAVGLIFLSLNFTSKSQVLFSEGFVTMVPLPAGWAQQNLSIPVGTAPNWFQGNAAVFPAQNGPTTSYAGCNFNSIAGSGTISNWLFTPGVTLKNGDVFTFYTRVGTGSGVFPDRLQVRMSTNGASVNVGANNTSVGDFTNLLLDINPTYSTTAYPEVWTQYTITIAGLAGPISGRLAFRYFVENGGTGANSNYIGVDNVVYTTFATACTGTPAPGNTLSTANPVCPNVNFTLSIAPPTAGGISIQWQSSPDNVTWTDIAGANNANLVRSQTVATWYRARVTCGANTGISVPLQVLLNSPANCYCAAGATSLGFEKISNVSYGTINNNSTSTAGYENFIAQTATMVRGQVTPISVTISGGFASDRVVVWIDFNQDGDFIDAGESVYTSATGAGPHVGNITISPTALVGTTRMRVRMFDTDFNTASPCGNTAFGQVEDYSVNIQPCVQGVFTSQPSSASIQCSGNASFSVTTTGSALTYQWQQRLTAASPWTTVNNGGVFSGATTTTLTLLNAPGTMDGYQFRAVMLGPCTSVDFSAPATLTVTPLVATVSPTAASICNGSIQQLTLTNPTSTPIYGSASNLPLVVPDGTGVAALSTIPISNVPLGAVVTNISVTFTMTHTWVGDVDINLIAPNGGNLNLVGGLNGGTGGNGTANFTNTVISSTSVTPISGAAAPRTGIYAAEARAGYGPNGFLQNTALWSGLTSQLNGNWRIAIGDFGGGDVGTLTSWSINIVYAAPPAQGVWTATAPNTMFTDALATVPYVAGSLASSIYVKPTASASYSVVYNTPTPCTSAPTTIPVTVVNPVTAVVNPVNAAACVGNNASFSVSAGGGGPFTYQWQVSTDAGVNFTNVAGATASSLTLAGVTSTMNNNRYRAAITAAPCVGATNSTSATLTVNPLPVVTLTASDLSLAPGQTSLITAVSNPQTPNFVWQLNGVTLTGVTGNTFTANVDRQGSYVVTATTPAPAGCTSSAALAGKLTIGAEASDKLWIYPNPTPGAFQVRLYYSGLLTERRKVSIFNSTGQLIQEKEFTLDNITSSYLRMDFDLSALAAGTYIVKVNNLNTEKIVTGLVIVQ